MREKVKVENSFSRYFDYVFIGFGGWSRFDKTHKSKISDNILQTIKTSLTPQFYTND